MTAKELIRILLDIDKLDAEVGIEFKDGWTSIKTVDTPRYGGTLIKLEPEDTLYDQQTVEATE